MRRNGFFLALIGAAGLATVFTLRQEVTRAQQANPGPVAAEPAGETTSRALPLTQVVLFNSGVGYFQREGAVEGNARVDLSFPAADVNDLLKSLVLQDTGPGKVRAVSYEGQEPVEKALKSFALDLTGNPTFGQLINQARGEKVELTLQNAPGAPASMTGAVVGMESQVEGNREVHQLNLLCAEGLRCLPLSQIQRLRFLNATLDAEFRHALDVLATAHNSLKRGVSLHFVGEGRRAVKVGYVVESPLWKTSYRLVLDKAGKLTLQGWAIIENTTDEDWREVRMALVSSRPISFQMDLYQPLFVPRPTVEPELFASLRPPSYQGPLTQANAGQLGLQGGGIGGLAGLGGGFNQLGAQGGFQGMGNQGVGGGVVGFGGQQVGQFGFQGGNRYQKPAVPLNPLAEPVAANRLTYEELQQRKKEQQQAREEAKKVGSAVAALDPTESMGAGALAESAGDHFQYTIEDKVSLPRQRSSLLPLVSEQVSGTRVSIYNEKVHARFPLRGLRFKNTTTQTLMQGPVAVYEGGTYAGDARLPDLQANEERLVSYAIDQGVEVKTESAAPVEELTAVRIDKGIVREGHRLRARTVYRIKNRSAQERALLVEHPIREGWTLAGTEKAAERTRDFYRFAWPLKPGQSLAREVTEEQGRTAQRALLTTTDDLAPTLLRSDVPSAGVKEALRKALEHRARLAATKQELALLEKQLKAITDDQARLRANLDKLPPTSAAHKRYLEKFDKQETQVEKLQAGIEEKQEKEKVQQKEFEDYLRGLTVE